MKLSQRLNALVENPNLKANKRDYNFARSLLDAYNRQGRLTPGRRPWLDKLEEKYSDAAVAERQVHLDSPIVARLEKLLLRIEGGWDVGFVESVLAQAKEGRHLSPRQMETIARLETENSDEALERRNNFTAKYNDESTGFKERMIIASKYYIKTPYYRDLARSVITDENFVPTYSQYNKIVENKYAKKVLEGFYSEPKFPVGSLIGTRSTAPCKLRNKMVIVVAVNSETPTSACAGNKVYQVLPIGEMAPVNIEERHLKKGKNNK